MADDSKQALIKGTGTIHSSKRWSIFGLMGYLKLLLTFIKYAAQGYWNWVRQSTFGWSIFHVITDFGGGIFFLLQMVMELILVEGTQPNFVKIILGLVTVSFNTLFLVQHYCLYN